MSCCATPALVSTFRDIFADPAWMKTEYRIRLTPELMPIERGGDRSNVKLGAIEMSLVFSSNAFIQLISTHSDVDAEDTLGFFTKTSMPTFM